VTRLLNMFYNLDIYADNMYHCLFAEFFRTNQGRPGTLESPESLILMYEEEI
jgi:hypothetical protein